MTVTRALTLLPSLLLAGCLAARNAPAGGRAESDLDLANRALKAGQTEDAIAGFRKALATMPENPEPMRGLVEAHFRAGRIEPLLGELERVVAANPSDARAHYGLGLGTFARSSGDEQKAVERLSRAAELRPQVAEYHFRLGIVHLEAERFAEAAASLRRARDLEPAVARHHVPLALALARTGDRGGALDALRAILELSPTRHDLDVARQVVTRLNDSFREFPKSIETEFERGLDYMQRADAPQQAMVSFQEILERYPDLAVVHAALGLCHQRLDDSGRAMEEFRRALELAPEDPLNHLYVADLYFAKERFDRAAEEYQAVVAQDPLADRAYERLGQMALQRGDYEEAVRWLRLLAALRPADPAAAQALGIALMGKGALDDAERAFVGILELDAKNVEALLRLGMLNLQRRSLEQSTPERARAHGKVAASYFEKVLDLQPQNVFAAKMLKALEEP